MDSPRAATAFCATQATTLKASLRSANRGNESGYDRDRALTAVGYEAALIGKYLNGTHRRAKEQLVPPGWDFLGSGGRPLRRVQQFQLRPECGLGKIVRHGNNARDYRYDDWPPTPSTFWTNQQDQSNPSFSILTAAYPHSPATPAPRHQGTFAGESAPHALPPMSAASRTNRTGSNPGR